MVDAELESRIAAALEACVGIDTSKIIVTIVPGGVILRGSLVSMDDRNSVVDAALRVTGVTSVGDEIDVPHHRSAQR
ncbi:hypothetical protein AX769_08340 [Frondihabitans sp. PAMC 28766]|nr:hypothetical protein AX769_08340 [Frondihabitans sp. PAMC 28766]